MNLEERRQVWNDALQSWLRERMENYSASTGKHSRLAWERLRRFLGESKKSKELWELRGEDFEAFAAWMREDGYAANTIYLSMGNLANFYQWCDTQRIDPECGVGFNPAREADRKPVKRYEGAAMLSDEEAEALLAIYRRDETRVGMRDYAFMLARLRTGVRLERLRRLRAGEVRRGTTKNAKGAKVLSFKEKKNGDEGLQERGEGWLGMVPGEVWEAIWRYLEAAGRLAGMDAGKYIFAPLAEPGIGAVKGTAEEWLEDRAVSASALLASLKLYGKRVGIAKERLTLTGLRNTAIRMRLEAGASLEEMEAFLDSRSGRRQLKYRLKKLGEKAGNPSPGPSPDSSSGPSSGLSLRSGEVSGEASRQALGQAQDRLRTLAITRGGEEVEPPNREPRPFQTREGIYHGLYAASQPPEVVAKVLMENIQGMDEEIVGLRILGRGLLERQARAKSSKELARLGDAYTKTAARLAELMRVEKLMAEDDGGEDRTEELIEVLDELSIEMGEGPVAEDIRREALGGEAGLEVATRRLAEEIAATRYVLRNTFQLAMEETDDKEYMHLVEIYSAGCGRLVRLLRMEGGQQERLRDYMRGLVDQAIDEVVEELGLDKVYGENK